MYVRYKLIKCIRYKVIGLSPCTVLFVEYFDPLLFIFIPHYNYSTVKYFQCSVIIIPLDAPPTHPETTSTTSESVWASLLNNREGMRPREETPGREGRRLNKRPESEQTNSKDIR